MTETDEREHVELSTKCFHVLLRMTCNPDSYTDRTRSLVTALHQATPTTSPGRWFVKLTREDIRTAVTFYEGYLLTRPAERMRLLNFLIRESSAFSEEFKSFTTVEDRVAEVEVLR